VHAVAQAARALARDARPHPPERVMMASTWLDAAAACLAGDADAAQGRLSGSGTAADCVVPAPRARTARSGCRCSRGLSVQVYTATAMISIIALLSACSDTSQLQVAQAASAPPAVTVESSPAVEAQVIAAYTGYFPVAEEAEPLPGSRAARLLAPWAAQPYLGQVLEQMTRARTDGEVAWGQVTPHVTSVEISSGHAVVRDCQDAHAAWLVSSVTGQAIPGSAGSSHTYLIAALARGTDGRWRLTWLAHAPGPCSPVPSPP
jgi:hypothetical protein